MSTITTEQKDAIAAKLANMTLSAGLGNEHSACSIAAINLALSGRLTDEIPDCMSEVVGEWIIKVQDSMPSEIRNSPRWKSLLPLAAGTGREAERERLSASLDWLWGTVLPLLQPVADKGGFGPQWTHMTAERTFRAAMAAAKAAPVVEAEAAAGWAARHAGWAAGWAAQAAAEAKAQPSVAVAEAAEAAKAAAALAAWDTFDPCAVLERLIGAGCANDRP